MSKQMAEAFVKNDIHMILFNTLYRDEKTDLNLSLSLASSIPVSAAGTPYNYAFDGLPHGPIGGATGQVGGARGPSGGDHNDNGSSSAEHDCKFLTN